MWSRCFVSPTISLSIFRVKPLIAAHSCVVVSPIVHLLILQCIEEFSPIDALRYCRYTLVSRSRQVKSYLFWGALICICSSTTGILCRIRLRFLWSSRRKRRYAPAFARQSWFFLFTALELSLSSQTLTPRAISCCWLNCICNFNLAAFCWHLVQLQLAIPLLLNFCRVSVKFVNFVTKFCSLLLVNCVCTLQFSFAGFSCWSIVAADHNLLCWWIFLCVQFIESITMPTDKEPFYDFADTTKADSEKWKAFRRDTMHQTMKSYGPIGALTDPDPLNWFWQSGWRSWTWLWFMGFWKLPQFEEYFISDSQKSFSEFQNDVFQLRCLAMILDKSL